jgi:HSP20 family protein
MSITNLIPWKRESRREQQDATPEQSENHAIDTFQQEMNQLFDRFFGRSFGLSPFWSEAERMSFIPNVDVVETDDAVRVSAELPGLDQKDIEISLDNDLLVIRGEKKSESEHKGRTSYRAERRYGAFSRSVRLPAEVKTEKAEATFKNGVLTVTLPKTETTRAKRIAVKQASE